MRTTAKDAFTRRSFVGVALSALALAACGSRNQSSSSQAAASESSAQNTSTESASSAKAETPESVESVQSAPSPQTPRVLVAYYSRADENYASGGTEWLTTGHTKVMAGYIADALGADQYEIVPVNAYPQGYNECCDVAKQEQADNARPQIAGSLPDASAYDVVFIGCPIWWGDEPMVVRTFVEGVNLSGKTVVPFTTHGGSGLGRVPGNLQSMISGATFLDGHAVAGTAVDGARAEVESWAKGLALA